MPYPPLPNVYKLSKIDSSDSAWTHFPYADDYVYWAGESAEEARENAARGTKPAGKILSASPWLDAEKTSCEIDYDSSSNPVSGVE